MKYVSAKEAKKYDIDSVNNDNITNTRKNVIYARVSCSN